MTNQNSYQLDFVVPKGPTGPIGSYNPLEVLIYATYKDTNTSGALSIQNSLNFPYHSNTFISYSDYIHINATGWYEFTISGYMSESQSSNNTSLILQTRIQNGTTQNNLITVRLNNNKESFFSYTKIGRYSYLQKVSLIFNKNENSDATLRQMNLIIKKLPWS